MCASVSDILHSASGWLGGTVLFSSVMVLQTGLYVCYINLCVAECALFVPFYLIRAGSK